jgi:hypothetical protein
VGRNPTHIAPLPSLPTSISAQLSVEFYHNACPKALPIIRSVVKRAISREPRMGASLLRLHFHDCFVNVSLIWVFLNMVFFIVPLDMFSFFVLLISFFFGFLFGLVLIVASIMS